MKIEEFFLLLNTTKCLEEEILTFLDYIIQESCNEAEEDISSAVREHMLSGNKEDIFNRLSKSIKVDILQQKGYPSEIPHPWWGTRKLKSFLLQFAVEQQQTIVFLVSLDSLSLDYIYRIKNPITLKYLDKNNLKLFLSNHHPNVVIRLMEKEYSENMSSEDIFSELLEVYIKLLTNYPHSLENIGRVRSTFQYYKILKKTLRDLTPEELLPVNSSLLEELQREFEQFEVKSPSNSSMLLEWGEHLSNCLGNYSQAIKDGETYIIGFFQESQLIYVAEILKSFELNQFKGFKNVDAPKHLQIKLKDYLKTK